MEFKRIMQIVDGLAKLEPPATVDDIEAVARFMRAAQGGPAPEQPQAPVDAAARKRPRVSRLPYRRLIEQSGGGTLTALYEYGMANGFPLARDKDFEMGRMHRHYTKQSREYICRDGAWHLKPKGPRIVPSPDTQKAG